MMKQFWIRLDPKSTPESKADLLNRAQQHCNVALLYPQDLPLVSNLKLKSASTDARADIVISTDLRPGRVVSGNIAAEVVVKESSDEQKAVELAELGIRYLIIHCPDWKVIPLENLIAKTRNKTMLLADVSTVSDAKVALQTLELGVDGVVFAPSVPQEVEDMGALMRNSEHHIVLLKTKVVLVKPLGTGARVCVDTCEIMEPGEGMLVGSQSSGLFLLEAEVHRNPHVEPRPFRVNAGPVSSYVLTPGLKTRYLSELKAGDEVLIINRAGTSRTGHIGRVKIERRPMTLVETEFNDRTFSIIVQNAETVRLVSESISKSVSELRPGDEVLIRVEEGGRHFGTLVADEMVIER